MLDVPRGCAPSPGASGRASETAQVRGLGYPVSRRPAAGTPAPPAPDTPKSGVAARHSRDSGHALSSLCRLSEEIWRGQSMAICRSGAYLRRSPWLIVREGVSRAASGLQRTPQKAERVGIRQTLSSWRLLCDCAFMPRCQVPSLLYWVYRGERWE